MKMNYKRYNNICKICDNIIKQKSNSFMIANNSVNIVKENSLQIEPFEKTSFSQIFLKFFKYFLLNFYYLLNFSKKSYLKINKKQAETVLVSHILNKRINPYKKEIYLKNFEESFKNKKKNYIKILINHTGEKNEYYEKLKKKNKNIFILPQNSSLSEELKVLYNMVFYFFKFMFNSFFENNIEKKTIFRTIAIEFLNPSTKRNFLIYINFKKIFSKLSFKNLLLTFEGFSWERLVLSACNDVDEKVNRIGYQFAGITKGQHSILRKLENKFDPDVIYTCGGITKKILRKNLKKKKIFLIGSERAIEKINLKNKKKLKKITCLVVPEGIIKECNLIFKFSVKCAKIYPEIDFIFRSHPSYNIKNDLKDLGIPDKIPNNIILSKNTLKNDIKKSNLCFYRGSTSVITALQDGVYPLYLNLGEKMNIDPLYLMKFWKTEINNIADFEKFISNGLSKKFKQFKKQAKAINFSRKYFMKFNKYNALRML